MINQLAVSYSELAGKGRWRCTVWRLILALIVLASVLSLSAGAKGDAASFPLDPVELLVESREVEGQPDVVVVHEGWTYHFTSEENRDAFLNAPERFEIQFGGACARMGPLSGRGRADLFVVHDERIFLFASPSCRETFLRNPNALLEQADASVQAGEAKTQARAQAALDRMAAAFGGWERISTLQTYSEVFAETRDSPDGPVLRTEQMHVSFPMSFRAVQTWNELLWANVATTNDAFRQDSSGYAPLQWQQKEALIRSFARHPVVLLHAAQDGEAAIAWVDVDSVDGRAADVIRVSLWGATTTLCIDSVTGDLLKTSHTGRGPGADMGEVDTYFGDYERVDGLRIPTARRRYINGSPWDGATRSLDDVAVDVELDEAQFTRSS